MGRIVKSWIETQQEAGSRKEKKLDSSDGCFPEVCVQQRTPTESYFAEYIPLLYMYASFPNSRAEKYIEIKQGNQFLKWTKIVSGLEDI